MGGRVEAEVVRGEGGGELTEQEYRVEVDRLRLLLQKATGARRALMVEIEPAVDGFRVVVTGITEASEIEAAQLIGDHLAVLLRGSYRWTVKAIHVFGRGTDKDKQSAQHVTDVMVSGTDTEPLPEEQTPAPAGSISAMSDHTGCAPERRENAFTSEALEACRKARRVIGSDRTLLCLPGESDRQCLNRSTREAIEALDKVIATGNQGTPSPLGSVASAAQKD